MTLQNTNQETGLATVVRLSFLKIEVIISAFYKVKFLIMRSSAVRLHSFHCLPAYFPGAVVYCMPGEGTLYQHGPYWYFRRRVNRFSDRQVCGFFFYGKWSGFAEFENTVDRGSAVNFGANFELISVSMFGSWG